MKDCAYPVLINPYPIGPYSGLLVPHLNHPLAQVINKDSLLVALQFNSEFKREVLLEDAYKPRLSKHAYEEKEKREFKVDSLTSGFSFANSFVASGTLLKEILLYPFKLLGEIIFTDSNKRTSIDNFLPNAHIEPSKEEIRSYQKNQKKINMLTFLTAITDLD